MIQTIRGFSDILPGEVEHWHSIEQIVVSLFKGFGFREIRIPVLERSELFARSIGEDTDIVEKEMYTFSDRSGDSLTLRPEATASVVRSYIQERLYAVDPVQKLYTIGPMFRRERPQKGRYRQFYQINAEVFGIDSPRIDAQLIFILMQLFERLKVTDIRAHVNSLGCKECRPNFRDVLQDFLVPLSDRLCEDCIRRRDRNPLRVLDCKVPACRDTVADAPAIVDSLCPVCSDHFDILQNTLRKLGVPFEIDKRLVRGLDYYTRATFEIQTGMLGAQSAIAGGGRYDGLVKMLGGPDIPATGFAIGLDRLAELMGSKSETVSVNPDVFIAALGLKAQELAFEWVCSLGIKDIWCEMDFEDRSLKSQMKRANKLGARIAVIIGDREIEAGMVVVRDLVTKAQNKVAISTALEEVTKVVRGD